MHTHAQPFRKSIGVRLDLEQSAQLTMAESLLGKSRHEIFREAIEVYFAEVLPRYIPRTCRCLECGAEPTALEWS